MQEKWNRNKIVRWIQCKYGKLESKMIQRMKALLLVSALVVGMAQGAAPTAASAATIEGDGYTLDEQGLLTITSDTGMEKSSKWQGQAYRVKEVVLEDGVTYIGQEAFERCNELTSIRIPDSVTSIGTRAFTYCRSLTEIYIPDSVTSIGNYAFEYCSSLTEIHIPESRTSIVNGMFYGCEKLSSINIPDSVTDIYSEAFYDCASLTNINIPDNVNYIGKEAFEGCSGLTEIHIPDSVTRIASGVFRDCSGLTEIHIPDSVTSIGDGAFSGCSGLTGEIHIPEGVTEIGTNAFRMCSSLTNITIPENLTSIEDNTFIYCESLKEIHIPEKVTSIGLYAFKGCSSLTEIHIPEGVTEIRRSAFEYCSGLTGEIHIPEGVTEIEVDVFAGCENVTNITIPEGVTSIGERAFNGCESLTEIHIPEGVTEIGSSAFSGCSGLTEMHIPERVTVIASGVFAGCSGLTEIPIPEGVTSIGDSAFANCSGLTEIHIPEGVTSIEASTFAGCSGLTEIPIPEGVTSIGARAFNGCSGLTGITIPEGVTAIADGTFGYCSSFTSISIPEGVTSIGARAFSGCSGLTEIHIPEGVTSIGARVFNNCSSLTGITIPEGVTTIAEGLFSNCKNLTEYTISANVTEIEANAFHECGLEEITIPANVTSIKEKAFEVHSLKSVRMLGKTPPILGKEAFLCPNIPNEPSNRVRNIYVPVGALENYYNSKTWEPYKYNLTDNIASGTDWELDKNGNLKIDTDTGMENWISASQQYKNQVASVTIEAAVTGIGNSAFSGCTNLAEVTMKAVTPPDLGTDVFKDCKFVSEKKQNIHVPDGKGIDYKNAWTAWADYIEIKPEATPEAEVDYIAGKLKELIPKAQYEITVDGKKNAVTADASGTLDLEPYYGKTVSIVKKGDGTEDSQPQTLTIKEQAKAPEKDSFTVTTEGAQTTVKNVTDSYEYSTDKGTTWKQGEGKDITVDNGTDILIRVKGTLTEPSSETVTIHLEVATTPEAEVDYPSRTLKGLVPNAAYDITVDGKTDTVTVGVSGTIDLEPYYGKSVSIIKKGNGTTVTDSAAQVLTVKAKAKAPEKDSFTVTTEGTQTTVKNVPADCEYSTDKGTTWKQGEGKDITVDNGTDILIRKKATETEPSSEAVTIHLEAETTPEAEVDYPSGTLKGLVPNASYDITVDGKTDTVTAGDTGTIDLEPYYGKSVSIIKKGNGTTVTDSAAQVLTIKVKTKAPEKDSFTVTTEGTQTTVKNVPADCEYSTDKGTTWKQGEGKDITVDNGTDILIRKKATETEPVSETVTIHLEVATTPEAEVDYPSGTLKGLVPNTSYDITVDGKTNTVTVGASGTVGLEPYYGKTVSIIKKGNGTTVTDSVAQVLTVKVKAKAPEKGSFTVTTEGTQTTVKNVPADCEYSTDGGATWKQGEGKDIAVDNGTDILIRKKATETEPASETVTIHLEVATTPEAEVDYPSGTLKGLVPNASYDITVDGKTDTVTVGASGTVGLEPYYGKTVSIIKKGNGTTVTDSAAQNVTVKKKTPAPEKDSFTVTTEGTQTIVKNVPADCEYSTDGGKKWHSGGTDITVDNGTEVLIRKKATETEPPSESVTVKAGNAPTSTPTGGPTSTPTGGATSTPTGGATSTPTGGSTSTPTGGATSTPTGGATSTPTGGATSTPEAVRETTPKAEIDYVAGKLKGLTPHAKYEITVAGKIETVTADASGAIGLEPYYGKTLSIVKKGNGTATTDSAAQTVRIAAKKMPPLESKFGTQVNDDANIVISNITSDMEYSLDDGKTWKIGTGKNLVVPIGFKVMIRVKAKVQEPVSLPAVINTLLKVPAVEAVERTIININTDKTMDVKGSSFSKIRMKAIGKGASTKLKWKKVKKVSGYIVYGARCGKKMKKLKTIKGASKKAYTHKKLKKGKFYKYIVVAYKNVKGKQVVLTISKSAHITTTKKTKYSNPKSVKVKRKLKLKKGKKKRIKASYVMPKKKKVKIHIAKFRYESSNPKVATVSRKGKVKGKKKGKAKIFVIAQNGVYKTVKVTVK